jgi:hypothetical protein
LLPAFQSSPPRVRTAGHLEPALVVEEAHHRVEIVRVEGSQQVLEHLDGHLVFFRRHGLTSVVV